MGRYFDTELRQRAGKPGSIPDGLTPARVRELNEQGVWEGPSQVAKKSK
ncbi:hypothetical protein JDS90_33780 [Bacillus cereus]|nr:hypothetical protein [Bacillus cereus]MBJ8038629.1 hypothetical protein [Bacillus cereus]